MKFEKSEKFFKKKIDLNFHEKKNTKKFVFCFSFPACGEIAILWLAILSGGKKGPLYNSVVGRGGPIKSNKTESNAFFL